MRAGKRVLGGAARMALLLALILLCGLFLNGLLLGFALWKTSGTAETPRLSKYVSALSVAPDGYTLPDTLCEALDEKGCWAMLLDGSGSVVWAHGKPEEVKNRFTLAEVARFTRWYLSDYPVRVSAYGDGLFVLASPKNSMWKYDASMPVPTLLFWPVWLLLLFACNFLLILLLSVGMTKRRYRSRDAARTEWIAAVSHDVRTPLSAVLGYAGSLESDETLPFKQREEAALIRQKGEELRGLVADLNLTNRLEHSMEPIATEWLSPAALIREVAADFLNGQLDERYSVSIEIEPAVCGWRLRGDRALLTRMLKNLIVNSIRHNPDGCAVAIELTAAGARRLILTVRDNGAGFPLAQLRQLHGKAAATTFGHGLGLTIVRQVAAAHHGRIRFSNSPSGGACCTVRFGPLRVRCGERAPTGRL